MTKKKKAAIEYHNVCMIVTEPETGNVHSGQIIQYYKDSKGRDRAQLYKVEPGNQNPPMVIHSFPYVPPWTKATNKKLITEEDIWIWYLNQTDMVLDQENNPIKDKKEREEV